MRVSVVNLYTEDLGNPEVPQKFLQARHKAAAVPVAAEKARTSRSWIIAAAASYSLPHLLWADFYYRGVPRRQAVTVRRSVAKPQSAESWTRRQRLTSPAAIPEKSIAVLPFENLSDEKQNAYFTDGVQDEILTDLARDRRSEGDQPHLSVMQYKTGVARNLREIGQAAWRRPSGRRQCATREQSRCG